MWLTTHRNIGGILFQPQTPPDWAKLARGVADFCRPNPIAGNWSAPKETNKYAVFVQIDVNLILNIFADYVQSRLWFPGAGGGRTL